MKVAELMTTELTTITGDITVGEAVVVLGGTRVHGLPVVSGTDRLVGVLSTSDVLSAEAECGSAGERERLFNHTLVREIMTTKPQTVAPDDDVKQAAQQMLYLDVHRLFVEYDGRLVGVISQSDIAAAVATAKL